MWRGYFRRRVGVSEERYHKAGQLEITSHCNRLRSVANGVSEHSIGADTCGGESGSDCG